MYVYALHVNFTVIVGPVRSRVGASDLGNHRDEHDVVDHAPLHVPSQAHHHDEEAKGAKLKHDIDGALLLRCVEEMTW
jgi:hypothetical protein